MFTYTKFTGIKARQSLLLITHMTKLLQGKKGLIMGLANDRSIAYGIAKTCTNFGAELAFSYQGEVLKKRAEPIAEELGVKLLIECDVSKNDSIAQTFETIKQKWGKLDFVVHSIGFSHKEELKGRYIDTSRDNFLLTMDISCYSFTAIAKHAEPLMKDGGSLLTLTYYGAEKAIPNYNVMGVAKAALEASVKYLARDMGPNNIRVNAISAGPIKTLAASGISGFRSVLAWSEQNAPLRRNTTLEDVGGSAAYLLSDLASGVTGEVIYVDSGYHIIGMPNISHEENH